MKTAAGTGPSLLLLLGLLACRAVSGQNQCTTMYRRDQQAPLLFGGVATNCMRDCMPRDDYWGQTCSFHAGTTWGVCNEEQRRHSLEYARTLGNGDILKMTPCHMLKFLRGRTLWLIGDSHSKTMYRALQCFLLDFWNHKECEVGPDSNAVQQLYNLPAAPGQSKCFHLIGQGGGRVCMLHVVLGEYLVANPSLPSGGVLPLLHEKFASKKDIFYINFGVWHKKSPEWAATFKPALEALGKYYQATKRQWPHMMFRETPAEHPKDRGGHTCLSMRGYTYQSWSGKLSIDANLRISVQGWSSGMNLNADARRILSKYKMPVIAAFNISVPLNDNHIGINMNPELDCLHYCNPGIPETWIWYLWNAMSKGKSGIKAIDTKRAVTMEAATRQVKLQCVPTSTMF